ncbi:MULTISPECIES: hypothetical protein [unclassified Variovorax]|uniref:hypothetical protein n=1 Tax=unclassified Variovorax TaxID=663243 RepID=UPI003F475034
MKTERFVLCEYCDDVRNEVDGKMSLIGCYQGGGLQINAAAPAVIPRLFVLCHVGTPKQKPFESLVIAVKHDGREIARAELPRDGLAEAAARFVSDETRRGYMLMVALSLPPLTVEKDGQIDVFIITEEGELQGNRLDVRIVAPS